MDRIKFLRILAKRIKTSYHDRLKIFKKFKGRLNVKRITKIQSFFNRICGKKNNIKPSPFKK